MDGDYPGVEEADPSSQLDTDPATAMMMESPQEGPGKDSGYAPETNESHLVETCGDSLDGGPTAEVVRPSSVVDDGARGGEGKSADLIVEERDSVAEVSDSQPGEGNMESGPDNLLGVVGEKDSDGGDVAEDKKGVFNGDELPLMGFPVAGVLEREVLAGEEQGEQVELVDGECMTDREGNQMAQKDVVQGTASEQAKEAIAMSGETVAQDASLADIVNESQLPSDDKEPASVAGILSQDKGSGDTVHRSVCQREEKEPLQEMHANEGAKDFSDGEARENVAVKEDILDGQCVQGAETETGARIKEERKADAVERDDVAVVENENTLLDVVASEVAEEKEASSDELSADVAQFAGETGNQMEYSTVNVEEMVEKEAEVGKFENIQLTEPQEEAEMCAKDEVVMKEGGNSAKNEVGAVEEGCAKEKVGREEENNGLAGVEEAAEKSEEEAKVDERKNTEAAEETERSGDERQKKDNDVVDEAQDMETLGDSSVADVAEGRENLVLEMGMQESSERQEETVMAEAGEEEAEGVEDGEEENKISEGKRKRGRNSKGLKGSGKKKEEDVCFICFDGGDLVLCDRRGCPKAYHPTCVGRDEAFFKSKEKWHCGWHLCTVCEKTATYLCYMCTFSLCKSCTKDTVFFCLRGNRGLCKACMETVKLFESKELEKKEQAQLAFDDKSSWEYLFKDYWIDLKVQLSLSTEELDQAKIPGKGRESHANKIQSRSKINYTTDGGSESDSPPKKRKTRGQSKSGSAKRILSTDGRSPLGENVEWASKELLDVVMHMRHGDRSFVPRSEVHNLLLEYIKRYNLRDPRRKSQVICDSKLQNLFRKSHVGHFEMLNLLDSHFLIKEDSKGDDLQENVIDTEASHLEDAESSDQPTKSGKDKRRKTRKKGDSRGRQSNKDDYAAIDMHNINLIYLRRNLVEDLLEDSTTFQDKVVGAFVRLRISGNQKQDLYRLVQIVGTSKAAEPYKVGKKTTDFVLEILNLDKTEAISIDIISNQDFTEDECKRLRQSIKCGLINRLTVGDIQEKAIVLHEVRVKNLLEAEIVRFSHLRDRASDMGRRKELRECVEKLQVLKSPEERQRRLEEIPDIHTDPSMDPNCESEDEDEKEEKEKDNYLRSRSSSFNRRGREPMSPRRGGLSSNDSWGGARNSSSANREFSRNLSGRGFSSRGDTVGASGDKMNANLWSSGRDREMQQSVISERPGSVYTPEAGARSSRSVAMRELSPRGASDSSAAPSPASVPQPVPHINESEKTWHYKDPSGKVQGPFSIVQLRKWSKSGYFPIDLRIWKTTETQDDSILLTDALAGRFHRQTSLVVDNSFAKAQPALHSVRAPVPELSSTSRAVPSTLEIPKSSQDAWSSGTSLPSPTPHQTTAPTPARRRNFESRWSPTPAQPPVESAVQLMNSSIPQSGLSPAPKPDVSMLRGATDSPQIQTQTTMPSESQRSQSTPHPRPTPNPTSVSVSLGSAMTLPAATLASGKQGWGSPPTQMLDSGGSSQIPSHGHRGDAPSSAQNSSPSFNTGTPGVFPQPGFPPPDSWRVPVPNQANAQPSAPPNLPWSMNMSTNQNPTQPRAPANQNVGWGPVPVNPNTGWGGPIQAGSSMSWSSVPTPAQASANPGWVGLNQGQAQMYLNPGWSMTGQAQAAGSIGSGWMQPGQGPPQPGNTNPNWAFGSQQLPFWGNQQNHNGDLGYGWNRQPPSTFGGSGGPNSKGNRICKFYRENGYCKKGASCDYIHN